jgi:hypothetical protein
MPVLATGVERRMRGGAQSFLLSCEDGHFYVVKFRENPQHRRILINEWLASHFLHYLGISAPEVRAIELTESFLSRSGGIELQFGPSRQAVRPGRHFGSRFPGNPHTDAAYDYLPDRLLQDVVNLPDFAGALVFDKWVSNADSRQAIFCRRRLADLWGLDSGYGNRKGMAALMVDHGFAFDGPRWEFSDAPLHGPYVRPLAYTGIRSLADFAPWLERLASMPLEIFDRALASLPGDWFDGDEAELQTLLERLWNRRARVEDLLAASIRQRPDRFPDWRAN